MSVAAEGFLGGDRTSLDLPAPQQRLLERVVGVGKPVVLVLMSGSALSVNWADAHVPAIVEAWYPGGQGGEAVARLIAGDFSPAGRRGDVLQIDRDLPPFGDYAMANRTYRYFEGEALYPFGYGLSYTRFAYANPRVSRARVRADGAVTVSVDITNTGAMEGDEVVQLYATHPDVPGAPNRALVGFERVHLARGETRRVQFSLRDRGLSIVDPDGVRRMSSPASPDLDGRRPARRPRRPAADLRRRNAIPITTARRYRTEQSKPVCRWRPVQTSATCRRKPKRSRAWSRHPFPQSGTSVSAFTACRSGERR